MTTVPSKPPGSAPALQSRSVSAAYGERRVLRDVSLREFEAGERVALVGPNGAGKSSLLRAIGGLLPRRSGSIELGGRSIDGLDRASLARRIAFVPQEPSLPFDARVEDIVGLGRIPHEDPFRGPGPADRTAVAAAIERVGVGHLLGRDVRALSLGERQLVLIAMAVAQETPILVLDEPTIHLDLRHQVDTMELLVDLNTREGTTILAVLHDLTLAAHFFGRLVLLDRGAVVADGSPSDVLSDDLVRGVFGVEPRFVHIAV